MTEGESCVCAIGQAADSPAVNSFPKAFILGRGDALLPYILVAVQFYPGTVRRDSLCCAALHGVCALLLPVHGALRARSRFRVKK